MQLFLNLLICELLGMHKYEENCLNGNINIFSLLFAMYCSLTEISAIISVGD